VPTVPDLARMESRPSRCEISCARTSVRQDRTAGFDVMGIGPLVRQTFAYVSERCTVSHAEPESIQAKRVTGKEHC
jgi:hypothetical protein